MNDSPLPGNLPEGWPLADDVVAYMGTQGYSVSVDGREQPGYHNAETASVSLVKKDPSELETFLAGLADFKAKQPPAPAGEDSGADGEQPGSQDQAQTPEQQTRTRGLVKDMFSS